MDDVHADGERPIALGDLWSEEHDDMDPGERREVRRSGVARHQHVCEIEQVQEFFHRRPAGQVQHAPGPDPCADVLRVGLLAGHSSDQKEDLGILQQRASQLGEGVKR